MNNKILGISKGVQVKTTRTRAKNCNIGFRDIGVAQSMRL